MMIFVLQDGWSPLTIAFEKGHLDIVKTLIEAGVNVNQTDKVGICALLLYSTNAHTVVSNVLTLNKQIHMATYILYSDLV